MRSAGAIAISGVAEIDFQRAITISAVDCLSFVVMQQQGLIDAVTSDQHFIQTGFRALLLET